MSDIENPDNPSASDDGREPRLATQRLVRAIAARLATPLEGERRDALVSTLAAAARDAGEHDADGGVDELSARRASRATSRGTSRMRRLSVAAAALVVIGGAVGVVTRSGDDLPVIVLASGSQAAGAPMLDAAGGPEAMRADASPMIGLWQPTIFTFELADGVTIGVSRAAAWRMAAPTDLAAAAGRIAERFGLAAPGPTEWDPRALQVQADSGASLWVSASGDWYYGGPSDLYPVWDCPEPVRDPASGELSAAECTPPAPPVGVPSVERARILAIEILASVGHTDVRILDVMADEWGAYVQGELVLPGSSSSSGVYVGVGFAGGERVSWANGTLARPELLGDYPLIDLRAALVRLEGDMNAWLEDGVSPMPRPYPADERDAGATVEPGAAEGSDGDAPTSDAPTGGDSPVSILPLPGPDGGDAWEELEPVERTVRVVAVELVTSMVWTPGDVMVLLPHYRLIDSDGGWWFVIAVEDRYLAR
jgi:hypothetical protein